MLFADRLVPLRARHRHGPGSADAVGARPDAVTFFIGSLFFTSAGFLQYREAVDAAPGPPGYAHRKVFVSYTSARSTGWLATGVQSITLIEFSTSAHSSPSGRPSALRRHSIMFGARTSSVKTSCFLVASALAWFEACHGWAAWRPRSLAWWITPG